MTTLRTRLERLEGKRGDADAGPAMVFICDAATGEPGAALMRGGGGLTREPGETEADFTTRASGGGHQNFTKPGFGTAAHPPLATNSAPVEKTGDNAP